MYNTNKNTKEEDNGVKCVWVFNSGDEGGSECDEEEEQMWNCSVSSIAGSVVEQEEVETVATAQVTPEPEKRVSRRGFRPSFLSDQDVDGNVNTAVSSALQRARERHAEKQKKDSRKYRRSLVKSSMLSLSQRNLNLDSSSSHSVNQRTRISMI